MAETFQQKRQWLVDRGFIVGLRLRNRNQKFPGAFSVCEESVCEATTDDASDGFCIVGDDLEELVSEAYDQFTEA